MTALLEMSKKMKPSNANEAWWRGFDAQTQGETRNPYLISDEKGGDVPAYWYWEAGWEYSSEYQK